MYKVPKSSFFLFGPRGTGKSTWFKNVLKPDLSIDLLKSSEFLELQRNPSHLEDKVAHLAENSLILIDEVQKLPVLLNEVHRLIESHSLRFGLTGSSSRKLKNAEVNLLGGRAHTYRFFPFSFFELKNKISINEALKFGTLPIVFKDIDLAEETLAAYVETYLKEEIKEEAAVRKIDDFSRFLEIAGQLNGHILNYENLAREAGKASNTIQAWYQILEDTLLGVRVPSFRPGFKVRELAQAKFYWFDPGVALAAAGLLRDGPDDTMRGYCLETLVLNEIRIYNEVSRKKCEIQYYSTPGSGEIDFIIHTKKKSPYKMGEFISIEVKSSKKWKSGFEAASWSLFEYSKGSHAKMYGVYLGTEILTNKRFTTLPFLKFVEDLHAGKIF